MATILLTLATIAAVVNVMTITMLKFSFENHVSRLNRIDFVFLVFPLIFLDLIIVSVLAGFFFLFGSILPDWFSTFAGAELVFLFIFTLAVSVLVWKRANVPEVVDGGKTSEDERGYPKPVLPPRYTARNTPSTGLPVRPSDRG
ncbi:hypothetical protein FALBO_5979 [Fusarium albosuccineum]|uniref:Transmembrane protein n=1 Tax=Fusarium albosuccineum TaxID=1237068 RepID=A0A8H4LFG3_9HYPO|nr:hypothetical protein FALBO_5979 [Fusarium albosuccineum]